MNSLKEGAHVMSVPVVLCKSKDAVLRLWAIITLGLAHTWLYRHVLKGTIDLNFTSNTPKIHGSQAYGTILYFRLSSRTLNLHAQAPSFCTSGVEILCGQVPFSIQAVHTLFKANGVSSPREYCTFYWLISGGWVHLSGALGYFFLSFSYSSILLTQFHTQPLLSAATCLC